MQSDRYRALDQRMRAALAGNDTLDNLASAEVADWDRERRRREQERQEVLAEARDQAAARAEAARLAALRGRARIAEAMNNDRKQG